MISINNKEPKEIYAGSIAIKLVYAGSILVWPTVVESLYVLSLKITTETEIPADGGNYTLEATLLEDGKPCSDSTLLQEIDVISDGSVSGYTIQGVGINTSTGVKAFQLKVDPNTTGDAKQIKLRAKLSSKDLMSTVLILYQAKKEEEDVYTLSLYYDESLVIDFEGGRAELMAELLHNGQVVNDGYYLAQMDIIPSSGEGFRFETYRIDENNGYKIFPLIISENTITQNRSFTFNATINSRNITSNPVTITQSKAEDKYSLTITRTSDSTISYNGGEFDINITLYKNGSFLSGALSSDFSIESFGDTLVFFDHIVQSSYEQKYVATLGISSNSTRYSKNGTYRIKYKDLAISNYLAFLQSANPSGGESDIEATERYILVGEWNEGDQYGNPGSDAYYDEYCIKVSVYDTVSKTWSQSNSEYGQINIIDSKEIAHSTYLGMSSDMDDPTKIYWMFGISIAKSTNSRSIPVGFVSSGPAILENTSLVIIEQEGTEQDLNIRTIYATMTPYDRLGRKLAMFKYKGEAFNSGGSYRIPYDYDIDFYEEAKTDANLYEDGTYIKLNDGSFYVDLTLTDQNDNLLYIRNYLPAEYGGTSENSDIELVCDCRVDSGPYVVLTINGQLLPDNYYLYCGKYKNGEYRSGYYVLHFWNMSSTRIIDKYTIRFYFEIDSMFVMPQSCRYGWSSNSEKPSGKYLRPFYISLLGKTEGFTPVLKNNEGVGYCYTEGSGYSYIERSAITVAQTSETK